VEKVPLLVLETHFMCLAHGLFSTCFCRHTGRCLW